jgi:hypothetical protein
MPLVLIFRYEFCNTLTNQIMEQPEDDDYDILTPYNFQYFGPKLGSLGEQAIVYLDILLRCRL